MTASSMGLQEFRRRVKIGRGQKLEIKEPVPYKEAFPPGTWVKVADRTFLELFMREWEYHHKLQPEQLAYAGTQTAVKEVAFYHGGDPVYTLKGVPGLWLEPCLYATS